MYTRGREGGREEGRERGRDVERENITMLVLNFIKINIVRGLLFGLLYSQREVHPRRQ